MPTLDECIQITIGSFLGIGLLLVATRPIAKWYSGNNEIIKLLKDIKAQNETEDTETKEDK